MITILLSLCQYYNISSLFYILYSFSYNRFKYDRMIYVCIHPIDLLLILIHSFLIFILIFILLQLQFNNSLPSFTYVTFNICQIHPPPPSESNQQIRFGNEQKYWKSHKGNSLRNINSSHTLTWRQKYIWNNINNSSNNSTKNKKKKKYYRSKI